MKNTKYNFGTQLDVSRFLYKTYKSEMFFWLSVCNYGYLGYYVTYGISIICSSGLLYVSKIITAIIVFHAVK